MIAKKTKKAKTEPEGIITGDCLDVMKGFPASCVDLIVTSPPYAMLRENTYGGIPEDEYVDWFLPRAEQFKRVLKPTGSFVLNIKEHSTKGQRVLYVYDLVSALVRKAGFMWVDDYVWHKPRPVPLGYPNRFPDAWEHLYHFGVENKRKMNRKAVKVPSSDANWRRSNRRVRTQYVMEGGRRPVKTGSGLVALDYPIEDGMVYPTNVLKYHTVRNNTGHSAPFPPKLPEFFIKLFTDEGDLVLDPFAGTGTTCRVARNLRRRWCGIEIKKDTLVDMSEKGALFRGRTVEEVQNQIDTQLDLF